MEEKSGVVWCVCGGVGGAVFFNVIRSQGSFLSHFAPTHDQTRSLNSKTVDSLVEDRLFWSTRLCSSAGLVSG